MPARASRAPTASARFTALAAALVLIVGLDAGRARAKEHGAGCAQLPGIIERLRNSLLLASVHRARGSSLAAYQVLRINAESLVGEPATAGCGAVVPLFRRALSRAALATSAGDAGTELDLAYTAVLAIALVGRMGENGMAAKRLDVPESAQYGEDCPDFLGIVRKLEAKDSTLPERAAAVLADLRARPRCAGVRSLLDGPADQLAAAVDALVLDEAQVSPGADNPIARCPELPVVLDRLSGAIRAGAPLYNRGDHDGCRRLYADTARALGEEVIAPRRCPAIRRTLGAALAEATAARTPGEAAWALRRGFDRIAGSVKPGSDEDPDLPPGPAPLPTP